MMNQISELDLQNLRHLIGGYDTSHAKMTEYASRAADPEVRQFFQKIRSVCHAVPPAADAVSAVGGKKDE